MITDANRVPLGSRGWIADGGRGGLVSADGTIDWYCPAGISGAPACWSLLDPIGGAVRVGPVRTGTGAGRRLPPFQQTYRDGSNVLETILPDGTGGRLSIVDLLPWSGPGQRPAGMVVRIVTALAGPVDVEVEVVPAGAWRPAHEVAAFEAGLVVDGLVVHTGFPLRFEPLGRDRPRWRGVVRLEPGETFVVTLEDSRDEERPHSVDSARRAAADTEQAWRSWLTPHVLRRPLPGCCRAEPAGRARPDRNVRSAGRGRDHLAASSERRGAQRRRSLCSSPRRRRGHDHLGHGRFS